MPTWVEAIPVGKGNHLKHRFIPSVLPGAALKSRCGRYEYPVSELRIIPSDEVRTPCPTCFEDSPPLPTPQDIAYQAREIPPPPKPRGPPTWLLRWRPKGFEGNAVFKCAIEVSSESQAYDALRQLCEPREIEILGATLEGSE